MHHRVLITGSTGTVGRLVTNELLRMNVPVTVLVRTAAQAQTAAALGARAVIGDLAEPLSLGRAMAAAQAVFLCSAAHPQQVRWHRNALMAARKAGVQHIVKLSAGRASRDSIPAIKRWHWETEQEIAESGLGYTHVRPNGFMQNFLRFRERITRDGLFSAPVGRARVSFIDAGDIAAVAVAALVHPARHNGRVYELTGPDAKTYDEAAGIIGAAAGRRVVFANETREEFSRRAIARGEPEWFVPYLLEIFDFIRSGAAADVSDDVARVTGRAPRTLAQFATDHARLFAAQEMLCGTDVRVEGSASGR